MRHVSVERNKLPAILCADTNGGHDNLAGGTIDDFCAARVYLAVFVNDERQCNRHSHRKDLRNFPVCIVGRFAVRCIGGVGIDLRAAAFFRKPA